MEEVTTIGLDLAKLVFQAHGADGSGAVVFRKTLQRHKMLAFFAAQPPCLVAPAFVKPFVKRQKNDAADAEAICEATQRPTIRFVAVKSEAAQASTTIFRTRDLLVRQRTWVADTCECRIGSTCGRRAYLTSGRVRQLFCRSNSKTSGLKADD